jgi:hypothetical protein
MFKKIVSGGQTGADRAALDFTIKNTIPHGGWVPKGRIAEDGPIAENYDLKEMPTDSYHARTEQNVIDSDGTLIISHGPLTGGSRYTHEMARQHHKPCLVIDLARTKVYEAGAAIMIWVTENKIATLNVAGPRASKNPYIYDQVTEILELVLYLFNLKKENPLMSGQESPLENDIPGPQVFLKTVDEVVESVLSELRPEEKSILAQTSEENLPILTSLLSSFIDTRIGDSTANQELIEDCRRKAGRPELDAAEASKVIIEAIWEKV